MLPQDLFRESPRRSSASPQRIFVLQLADQFARLTEVDPDEGLVEHPLRLPHGAQVGAGDRTAREGYARAVHTEVMQVVPAGAPLFLAATDDFSAAYRAASTHDALLDDEVGVHPASLDDRELEEWAHRILDRLQREELARRGRQSTRSAVPPVRRTSSS